MRTLDNYIGLEPFTVFIDDSPRLRELAVKARDLRDLPFVEKLESVKRLALDAMINAYEQMIVLGKTAAEEQGPAARATAQRKQARYQDIVFQKHPLSDALEQKAGCCRYQGALFFVLGFEAGLGDQHFLQAAPVNSRANTVFNEVVQNGQSHKISIFTESLADKSLDYSRQNLNIFEQAFTYHPHHDFYSYHRTPNGLAIVENPCRHCKSI